MNRYFYRGFASNFACASNRGPYRGDKPRNRDVLDKWTPLQLQPVHLFPNSFVYTGLPWGHRLDVFAINSSVLRDRGYVSNLQDDRLRYFGRQDRRRGDMLARKSVAD